MKAPTLLFEDIQAMLKAHIEVLLAHKIHIMEIEKNQNSDDEIISYFTELFNFRVPLNDKYRTEYIPALKDVVEEKLFAFIYLNKVACDPNKEVAMATLYLALKTEVFLASRSCELVNSVGCTFKQKIQFSLHRVDSLKSISCELEKILPSFYQELSTFVEYEQRYDKKNRHSKSLAMPGYAYNFLCVRADIEKDMDALMALIQRAFELDKSISKLKGWKSHVSARLLDLDFEQRFESISNKQLEEFKSLAEDCLRSIQNGYFEYARLKEASRNKETEMSNHLYQELLVNVRFFHALEPKYNKIKSWIKELTYISKVEGQLSTEILDVKKQYDKLRLDMLSKKTEVVSKVKALKKAFKGTVQIGITADDLLQYDNIMSPLLKEFEAGVDKVMIKRVRYELDKHHSYLLSAILDVKASSAKMMKDKMNSDVKVEPDMVVQLTKSIAPKVDEQREWLLEEEERKNREYKAKVEQSRAEKVQAKLAKKNSAMMTPCAQPITTVKNMEVEKTLLGLSDKHFLLLQSLFNFHKGVRYDDVCNLIIQQLDGKIEELGSSHKRIKIAKFYIEITSYDSGSQPNEPVSCVQGMAVGGFFRPHGTAHQPGVLGLFNMKLVVKTFTRAGITPVVLNDIAEQRHGLSFESNKK